MASPPYPSVTHQEPRRYACLSCARRKVKCDRSAPCSNCLKAPNRCVYENPTLPRPRKRAGDQELLARLALYEDLMRKHGVDFSSCANTWIPSPFENKPENGRPQSPVSMASAASRPTPKTCTSETPTTVLERCLWLNLSPELKHHPMPILRHRHDPLRYTTSPLRFKYPNTQPEVHELHPEPKHALRLWQIFIEKVNPLTKIIHVPTLQQRVLDAIWEPSKASKSLSAVMFAIYNLVVTPMSSDDCQAAFGETNETLVSQYRAATMQALVAADFLTTRDLEVMQAFVLFLFTDPESELTCTLSGAAIRLGEKMGLHRESTSPQTSFFEKEMGTRLWWQLRCLDARSRAISAPRMKLMPPAEFGDVHLPLNVNDADLHPDMVEPPIEHDAPTEMQCVLIKFEVLNWLRFSPSAAIIVNSAIQGPSRANVSMEVHDATINELEAIFQCKYLRNRDRTIPLHDLTHVIATFTVARMRFRAHHPRNRVALGCGDLVVTREENDLLFNSALTSLEMADLCLHGKLASHLFVHFTYTYQLDAYIYVLSDLRRRCSGDRVALAWRLVEDLYSEHPELIDDPENNFFVALGDLTLEAWDARGDEMSHGQDAPNKVTPQFIRLLRDKRASSDKERGQTAAIPDPHSLDGLMLADDIGVDWAYWNDFLRV